jgi:hypothetical protein
VLGPFALFTQVVTRQHNLCGHWRDELQTIEVGLRELEAQCSEIDESAFQEKAWTPAPESAPSAPRVEHTRPNTVRPGQPLRLTARVVASSGIESVRLRYRHVTQFEDYQSIEMSRTGEPDEFTATVTGDFLVPQWDFMYFIEAIDRAGRGVQWPDLALGAPYVIVKLQRQ